MSVLYVAPDMRQEILIALGMTSSISSKLETFVGKFDCHIRPKGKGYAC